jgi:hypothetical protein
MKPEDSATTHKTTYGTSLKVVRGADSSGTRLRLLLISVASCASAALMQAQAPSPAQVAQERANREGNGIPSSWW